MPPRPGPSNADAGLPAAPSGGPPIAPSGVLPSVTGTPDPAGMFTPAQLAFILQNMPAAMPPTQPAPPGGPSSSITPLSFPRFTLLPSAAAPGVSLLDLFPNVEASVLLEIASHEFKPSDLYKLDSKYRDKGDRSEFLLGDGQTLKVKADGTRDYGSYNALQAPLSLYFSILVSFAGCGGGDSAATALIARAGFTYLRNLYKMSQDYEWPAVLSYHMEFHWRRRREMTNGDYSQWGRTDPELQADFLIGRARIRSSKELRTFAKTSATPRRADVSKEVCILFQSGFGGCTGPVCQRGRIHKCVTCGGLDHGSSSPTCPNRPK